MTDATRYTLAYVNGTTAKGWQVLTPEGTAARGTIFGSKGDAEAVRDRYQAALDSRPPPTRETPRLHARMDDPPMHVDNLPAIDAARAARAKPARTWNEDAGTIAPKRDGNVGVMASPAPPTSHDFARRATISGTEQTHARLALDQAEEAVVRTPVTTFASQARPYMESARQSYDRGDFGPATMAARTAATIAYYGKGA